MKKEIISIMLVVLVTILGLPGFTVLAVEGAGTVYSPYVIETESDLFKIANEDFENALSSHYILKNDIVMTTTTWVPIGITTAFSGVFDGNGHTISGVNLEGSGYDYTGFFGKNSGTIKNLTVDVNFVTGGHYAGGLVASNTGIIDSCLVKGSILLNRPSQYASFIGGLCGQNSNTITKSGSLASVKITGTSGYSGFIGGLIGSNNSSASLIENSYSLGKVIADGSSLYVGGLIGSNSSSAKIKKCYAACEIQNLTTSVSYVGGINGSANGTVMASYYDSTVTGCSDNTKGTPLTTAQMKAVTSYAGWDFDTIWGIDGNINNGYPYLLWQYPDVEAKLPYTLNSVKITDLAGNELLDIPGASFYFEVNVTKNTDSKEANSLIIAVYDEKGILIDTSFMRGTYYRNQSITFGTMITETDKKIGSIKSFVWDSISGMTPLSNSMGINN